MQVHSRSTQVHSGSFTFGFIVIGTLIGRSIALSIRGGEVICATGVHTANILTTGLRVWFLVIYKAITVRITLPLPFLALITAGSTQFVDTAGWMLWGCGIQHQAQGKKDAARVSLTPPQSL